MLAPLSTKTGLVSALALALLTALPAPAQPPGASHAAKLFKQDGGDPTFAEVLESGAITPGERFSKGPVRGSRVHVNHELLVKQTGKAGSIPARIGIHTQGSGGIARRNFGHWTRWYQEDGNTQVFRLFKGEQNVRDGVGEAGSQGRIEAYCSHLVEPGTWSEWEGTYTIIEPLGANIFQLFHDGGQLWPFHLRMNAKGDVYFHRRRAVPDMPRTIVLAEDMVGKSFRIKVRANGTDYEVFCKDPADSEGWGEAVAKGSYIPAKGNKISFRWGMYVGSRKGQSVSKDGMLFVTGVTIK